MPPDPFHHMTSCAPNACAHVTTITMSDAGLLKHHLVVVATGVVHGSTGRHVEEIHLIRSEVRVQPGCGCHRAVCIHRSCNEVDANRMVESAGTVVGHVCADLADRGAALHVRDFVRAWHARPLVVMHEQMFSRNAQRPLLRNVTLCCVAWCCDVYVAWRHRTAMSVRSASQGVSGVRAVRLARAQMCLVSIGECHQLSTRWTTMYSCISESTTDVPRHDQTLNYRPEAFGDVAPGQYDAGCPRAPPHSAPVAIGTARRSAQSRSGYELVPSADTIA